MSAEPADQPTGEQRAEELVRAAREARGLARGAIETVRAVEKGIARVVFLGADVDRAGLSEQLRRLCAEHDVPIIDRFGKKQLGAWAGLERPSAALAVTRIGSAEAFVAALVTSTPALVRSLSGLQQTYGESLRSKDLQEILEETAESIRTVDEGSAERAVTLSLRATIALAVHHGVDLQRVVDRWTLKDWLAATSEKRREA